MTEEEITALKVAKETAEKSAADAKALADKAEADKLGLVEELKTERQKKQEAIDKLNINNGGQPDVNTLVEQALGKQNEERRKAELEQAISEFKASKPEFQADAAGLVYSEFAKQLNKFNLSDLNTKEQAKSRLEEIYRFVNFKTEDGGSTYEGTRQGAADVKEKEAALSAETKTAIESSGLSTEKFTALKSKYADAFNGLGIN